jgi:predicted heme/steroid binding protein
MRKIMRKALIIMILLLGLFLAIGCVENKQVTPSEKQNMTGTTGTTEFTREELANYDGRNGNKTYVAVQGKVYDVSSSSLWGNGFHNGHNAGQDLTYEISRSPHGTDILKGYPVVGTYKYGT